MAAEDVYGRIQEKLKKLKLSPRAASLAAGRGPDAIRNLQRAVQEGKDFDFRSGTIEALATVLQTTPEWLLQGRGSELAPFSQMKSQSDRGDMPIFSTFPIDGDRFEISSYVVARIKRTHSLENVQIAYGLIVETESMMPVYEPGDAILIHPGLGGSATRDVVVRLHDAASAQEVGMIRRILGRQGSGVVTERYNPPEQTVIDRWSALAVIVGRLHNFM